MELDEGTCVIAELSCLVTVERSTHRDLSLLSPLLNQRIEICRQRCRCRPGNQKIRYSSMSVVWLPDQLVPGYETSYEDAFELRRAIEMACQLADVIPHRRGKNLDVTVSFIALLGHPDRRHQITGRRNGQAGPAKQYQTVRFDTSEKPSERGVIKDHVAAYVVPVLIALNYTG